MFIDTCVLRCYYISVRLCTGGVRVPLNELFASPRTAGFNSVQRKAAKGEVCKIFLADDADEKLAGKVKGIAAEYGIPIEPAENSQKLGRACALTQKTAVAAVLKKVEIQ